jgi:hypothetical protein|uniref:Uncharacterized protein n=1 Tax=viral metagenome TaxID=1070528 RepID=A0A6C0IRF7_9ZZZZ
MSATLLPNDMSSLLTLYKQIKNYHPECNDSFMAMKNHANMLKSNLEKKLKGPIHLPDYECWYEIQSDKTLDSQVPYLTYKDNEFYV